MSIKFIWVYLCVFVYLYCGLSEYYAESSYSQTSVIERFGSRPNRFSNKKFEIFTFQTSNKNSDHDQTKRIQTDQLLVPINLTRGKDLTQRL